MSTTTPRPSDAAVTERRPRSRTARGLRKRHLVVALRYALMLIVLVITVGPFLWQLATSLKGPAENIFAYPPDLLPSAPTLANYPEVTRAIPLWRYIANSLLIAVPSTLANCLFGAMAGYALARMQFRGQRALFALMIATLIIPFEVIMISVFLVTQTLGLVDTLVGVFLPQAVTVLSIFIMRQGFLSFPREVEEAAVIDGANEWQTFRHVALPAVGSQLAVVAIFSFIFAWDDFLWPLIVLRDPDKYTLTIGLEFLSGTFSADQRLIAAGTIIAVVPLIVMFVALQKQFFRGVGQGAVKG